MVGPLFMIIGDGLMNFSKLRKAPSCIPRCISCSTNTATFSWTLKSSPFVDRLTTGGVDHVPKSSGLIARLWILKGPVQYEFLYAETQFFTIYFFNKLNFF